MRFEQTETQVTFTCNERHCTMTKLSLFKNITLALGCAMLAMTDVAAEAGGVKGHAGTTFDLTPVEFGANGIPTKYTHTVNGVVRVFELGNCTFHADVIVTQANPTAPFILVGTFLITTADGKTSLTADAAGVGTPDPSNPGLFLNFHYDLKFTGGTGVMENAHGTADVDGFAMFTLPFTGQGKATWLLEGNVSTRGPSHSHDD
jgi:hypothetical protein